MHSAFELPSLRAVSASPGEVAVDLLVALYPGQGSDAVAARLSAAARQDLAAAVSRGEPVSDAGRAMAIAAGDPPGRPTRVLVVGTGPGP